MNPLLLEVNIISLISLSFQGSEELLSFASVSVGDEPNTKYFFFFLEDI